MSEAQRLASGLLELRDELPSSRPLLTRAAQMLTSIGHENPGHAESGSCEQCGGPIDQLPRGRPRRYCTICSPRKKTEKGKVRS